MSPVPSQLNIDFKTLSTNLIAIAILKWCSPHPKHAQWLFPIKQPTPTCGHPLLLTSCPRGIEGWVKTKQGANYLWWVYTSDIQLFKMAESTFDLNEQTLSGGEELAFPGLSHKLHFSAAVTSSMRARLHQSTARDQGFLSATSQAPSELTEYHNLKCSIQGCVFTVVCGQSCNTKYCSAVASSHICWKCQIPN